MYDIYAQAVSTPAKTALEYNSTVKSLPESSHGRRPPADVAPELHARPVDFRERLITDVQRRGKVRGCGRNSQDPTAGCDKAAIRVLRRTGMKNLHCRLVNPIKSLDYSAFFVFTRIAFIGRHDTRRRAVLPFDFQLTKRLVVHGFEDGA